MISRQHHSSGRLFCVVFTLVTILIVSASMTPSVTDGADVNVATDGFVESDNLDPEVDQRRIATADVPLEPESGALDPSFGSGGQVTMNVANDNNIGRSIAVQADGKILLAGSIAGQRGLLVRYAPGGQLDTSFGNQGRLFLGITSGDAIALQADGRILVAGNNDRGISVVRLNIDGTVDPTFGSDGSFDGVGSAALALAVQDDGKILVAGSFWDSAVSRRDTAVYRLLSDGTLDTSFSRDGLVISVVSPEDDEATAVAIQLDGKIVVAGWAQGNSGYIYTILRYLSNGRLDSSFDGDGIAIVDIGSGDDYASSIALQPDGKIVAAGTSVVDGTQDFSLVRLNANGSLDLSFDGDGKATTALGTRNDRAFAVMVQDDGKIVAAGWSRSPTDRDFAIARYDSNGSLDRNFDGDGLVLTDVGGDHDESYCAALAPDGRIIVAGSSWLGNEVVFSMARYGTNGSLDVSFGGDGMALTGVGGSRDTGNALAMQNDGKIVIAGKSILGTNSSFLAMRLNQDGSLDPSFSGGGKAAFLLPGEATDIGLLPDGRVILAGPTENLGAGLVRLNSDGSLDRSFDGDGKLTVAYGRFCAAAFLDDGHILVLGDDTQSSTLMLARLSPDGSLDPTFGQGGIATAYVHFLDRCRDAAIQNDGRIVVSSWWSYWDDTNYFWGSIMTGFLPDGNLDHGFVDYGNQMVAELAIQPDGKIVAVETYGGFWDRTYMVTRYNSDGSRDTSYSAPPFPWVYAGGQGSSFSTALQADGKIAVAAFPVLARYNTDGSADTTFGFDGIVITNLGSQELQSRDLVVQSDGKYVLTGQTGIDSDVVALRYTTALTSTATVSDTPTPIGATNVRAHFVSGGPCTVSVEKQSVFPNGSPSPGKMPIVWQMHADCSETYDMTLALCYTEDELAHGVNITEDSLTSYSKPDRLQWHRQPSSVNTLTNCVTQEHVSASAYFTLGDPTRWLASDLFLPQVSRTTREP